MVGENKLVKLLQCKYLTGDANRIRKFKKYGHKCQMGEQLDVLNAYIPGFSCIPRFRKFLTRIRLISECNTHSINVFKSQGAILEEKNKHLKFYFNMIHPFSDFRRIWETIMAFLLIFEYIIIPLDTAFVLPNLRLPIYLTIFRWLLDLLFIIFIILNFATGYCDIKKKETEMNPRKVAIHYVKTYFIVDVIGCVPMYLEDIFPSLKKLFILNAILNHCCIFKFCRFYTMIKYFQHIYEERKISSITINTTKLVLLILVEIHIVNCFLIKLTIEWIRKWGTVVFSPKMIEPTFISDNIMLETSRIPPYIKGMHASLAILTLSSQGMGNPTTQVAVIFPIVLWCVAMMTWILATAQLCQALRSTTSSKMKYSGMVSQLKEYMRGKELPMHMQKRLLAYYEFRFQKSYFRESEILKTISGQLRQEILLHSCKQLVEKVVFFENLPSHLLVRIASLLHSEIFLINDVICYGNTVGNCMYFIGSGSVAIYTKSGKEIQHLEDGGHFGEVALVRKDQKRIASVVAIESCQLYRLDRWDFVKAISHYPDLYEKIQKIVDDRLETTTNVDDRWKAMIRSRNVNRD